MPQEPENLLLVEGKDEQHIFWSLLQQHDFPEVFGIFVPDHHPDAGGKDMIKEAFATRLKVGNQRRLGVVLDADEDLDARWRSLRDVLRKHGYSTAPDEPDPMGAIIPPPDAPGVREDDTQFHPVVGIWLMPNNQLPGTLEDFLRWLVPPDDPDWTHAEGSVATLPSLIARDVNEAWLSKARLHTWLAWQEEPGKPFGTALTARYLRADAEAVQPLLSWLRRLFVVMVDSDDA